MGAIYECNAHCHLADNPDTADGAHETKALCDAADNCKWIGGDAPAAQGWCNMVSFDDQAANPTLRVVDVPQRPIEVRPQRAIPPQDGGASYLPQVGRHHLGMQL